MKEFRFVIEYDDGTKFVGDWHSQEVEVARLRNQIGHFNSCEQITKWYMEFR